MLFYYYWDLNNERLFHIKAHWLEQVSPLQAEPFGWKQHVSA